MNRRRRQLRNVLVLLVGISLAQYLTTGAVRWPATLYQTLSAALASAGAKAEPQVELSGRVVRVADGDTVTVLDRHNTQHKVRLFGIDTPERNQPYGRAAKNALVQLIDNRPVEVVIVTQDSYGRTVGMLYRDGINLNEAMVAAGYAWWYQHFAPHERRLQEAEQRAREQRLGLWADPRPVPPWDWRRAQRQAR